MRLSSLDDGGAFTTGYPDDAAVILSTVTPHGGPSKGRRALNRCHYGDVPLTGGPPRPTLADAHLDTYFFSDADPLVVCWPPQRIGPLP